MIRLLPVLILVVPLLLVAGEAWARVGGGQGYSGGGSRSSGGGSYSGGGGGGDGGAIIELLIWLCIRHPAIGIPLTLFVVGVVIYTKFHQRDSGYVSHRTRTSSPRTLDVAAPLSRAMNPKAVVEQDPNFSEPLFIDFVQLAYVRAQVARGDGQTEALRPLMTDAAIASLLSQRGNLKEVRDVIFGSTNLAGLRQAGGRLHLQVELETNLTEVRPSGESQVLRKERWTFGRQLGVLSPGPEGMRSLGCPSCGSTQAITLDGRCPNCSTVRTGGASQWEVETFQVLQSAALTAPQLQLGGGMEHGTQLRTVQAPDLGPQSRALLARHPAFAWETFNATVESIFLKLQEAWSTQRWELARPYETDALFQTHRFWMERYRRFGLVNKVEQVSVRRIELARIGVDAFYESITVRVFASMLDWTEQGPQKKVVAGSTSEKRVMSEYWTFIRRIGGKARPDGGGWDAEHCPSCGAPLDNVSQTGVCGYCEATITTGDFDWVLTRIEQDEAYRG